MLDPEAEQAVRDGVIADVRGKIEKAGSLDHSDDWGTRKLAYEIERRTEADYRYYRFQGGSDLLDDLTHSLKIAEGTLRFRIFRVDPESPTTAPPVSDRPAAVGSDRPDRGDRGDRPPRRDDS